MRRTYDTIEEYLLTQSKGHLKRAFMEAFRKVGLIAPACRAAGVSRSTYYRWMETDADFNGEVFLAFGELYIEKPELFEQVPKQKQHTMFEDMRMCEA